MVPVSSFDMRGLSMIVIAAVSFLSRLVSADSFASLGAAASGGSSTPYHGRRRVPETWQFGGNADGSAAANNVPGDLHQVPRIVAELAQLQMQHRQQVRQQHPFAAEEGAASLATPGLVPSKSAVSVHTSTKPLAPGVNSRAPLITLRECMATGKAIRPFTIQDFVSGRAATLKPELELSSSKPAAIGVTVLTISTLGRISRLEGLCASWGGPLSAAVYVGLSPAPRNQPKAAEILNLANEDEEYDEGDLGDGDPLLTAMQIVQDTFDKIERNTGGCQLTITLLSELLASAKEQVLFPYNALRNVAHLEAKTPLVLNVDTDMLLSRSLTATLSDPIRYQHLFEIAENRTFIVVPAFEAISLAGASTVISSKAALVDALNKKQASRFAKHYPPGHASTNYSRWTATKPGGKPTYETKYSIGFEGWGIVSRGLAPMWDVKYRGYGKDKIAWTSHLHRASFRFVVSADTFMVHRPHKSSPARASFVAGLNRGNTEEKALAKSLAISSQLLGSTNGKHMNSDKKAHEQHRYRTLVGNTAKCRDILPHWRIFGSAGALPIDDS